MKIQSLIFNLTTGILTTLAWSHASQATDRHMGLENRMELRRSLARTTTATTLRGFLGCKQSAQEHNISCMLKFIDDENGQAYRLKNENQARTLYEQGRRSVSITGTIQEKNEIEITSIEAI